MFTIPPNYTLWFFSMTKNIYSQIPGTGKMTRREANTLAKKLRQDNSGKMQVAVYRGKELRSCFGYSDNNKVMITS